MKSLLSRHGMDPTKEMTSAGPATAAPELLDLWLVDIWKHLIASSSSACLNFGDCEWITAKNVIVLHWPVALVVLGIIEEEVQILQIC